MNNNNPVKRDLQSVGMRAFVNFYPELKNQSTADCRKIIFASGIDKDIRGTDARVYHGKAIFNKHLEREALEMIVNAKKVDEDTRNGAIRLLAEL